MALLTALATVAVADQQDIDTAVTGTAGDDVVTILSPTAATARIEISSSDAYEPATTRATGIDALAGDDQITADAALGADATTIIDIDLKELDTKGTALSAGICAGDGQDQITNNAPLASTTSADIAIGDFSLVMTIGVNAWPTQATAQSVGMDGAAGADFLVNNNLIMSNATAGSEVLKGRVDAVNIPRDFYARSDARNTATAVATGITGGSGAVAPGARERIANNGTLDIDAAASTLTVEVAAELIGAAYLDDSTTSTATAGGISGSALHDIITNTGRIDIDAEARAEFGSGELKWRGLFVKPIFDLIGFDVGNSSTTATAEAVGIRAAGGNDTVDNGVSSQLFDVYGKASSSSYAFTLALNLSTGAEAAVSAMAAGTDSAGDTPVADNTAPDSATFGAAATTASAKVSGIVGEEGNDDLSNNAALKSEAEADAFSLAVSADVSLSEQNYIPLPGVAIADTSTAANATAIGIDGGSGDDALYNTARLDAIATAEAQSSAVGATISGSLEGFALGGAVTNSSSSATALAKGIADAQGTDSIENTDVINALATSHDDASSVSVTAAGAKVGMAFGVALADASTTSSALSFGIDAVGQGTENEPLGDSIWNLGTILSEAVSTSTALSVATTFSAALEGIVGGISAVKGDGTAEAFATGIRSGMGADQIFNQGDQNDILSAIARATGSSDSVAVTISAALKGVALGASLADSATAAKAEAAGIDSGAGDDMVVNDTTVVSRATADVASDTVSVTLAVAPKGVSLGYAVSNAQTNAEADAAGIRSDAGDDGITNQALIDVDAVATTRTKTITLNFAEAGLAVANVSSEAKASAVGLDGGNGIDTVMNAGTVDVTAAATADDTAGTANFVGKASGDVVSTATTAATGIRNDAGSVDSAGDDTITNAVEGSVSVLSHSKVVAKDYTVQGGGAAFADTGAESAATAKGLSGGVDTDVLHNAGDIDVTAWSEIDASSFVFQLTGVESGHAGANATGTAIGIFGNAGLNAVTNDTTGSITSYARVDTLATALSGGFGINIALSGATADALSQGIGTGDDDDIVDNYGDIDATAAASGSAGSGSIGLFSLDMANSLSQATVEGINAGGGDDVIRNFGSLRAGTVRYGDRALAYADTAAVSFDFYATSLATLGARAWATGIAAGAGDDSILNSGAIAVGGGWTAFGEAFAFGGQYAGTANAYAGSTAKATAVGIDAGPGRDAIVNDSSGGIIVHARSLADVESVTNDTFGFVFNLASASANAGASGTGIQAGAGDDAITNAGFVYTTAYTLADSDSNANTAIDFAGTTAADAEGNASAIATAIDAGAGQNYLENTGKIEASATALSRATTRASALFEETHAESEATPTATATGILAGNDGTTVVNLASGRIFASSRARTEDALGNISQAVADKGSTALAGSALNPVTANALGIALGDGDDNVLSNGTIQVDARSDPWIYAHATAGVRNSTATATAYSTANATGIAAGAGANNIIINNLLEVTSWSNARPSTHAWSGICCRATAKATAYADASATGIEADGALSNAAGGDMRVTARATSDARAVTEAETTDVSAMLTATATGLGTESSVASTDPHRLRNDGTLTVTALAGEHPDGSRAPIAFLNSNVDFRGTDGDAIGTARTEAAGFRVGAGATETVNTGDLSVVSRARPYLDSIFFSVYGVAKAGAYVIGEATAAGFLATGGEQRVYNYGTLEVTARVQDAFANSESYSDWSTCVSRSEIRATATATGISTGAGDDEIFNIERISVVADADAESRAFANVYGDRAGEWETTRAWTEAEAMGISVGAGSNAVYNSGELTVRSIGTALARAKGGHASVTLWEEAEATASGIVLGDEGDVLHNSGTIDVLAGSGAASLESASAVGVVGGGGNDVIVNAGAIFTGVLDDPDELRTLVSQNQPGSTAAVISTGTAIRAGGGHDEVYLVEDSRVNGRVELGDGNDLITLRDQAIVTGAFDGGEGRDRLTIADRGSFTVQPLVSTEDLEVNQGQLVIDGDYALPSGGLLEVELYDPNVNELGHGQLVVNGNATLDGSLSAIALRRLYGEGETFDLMTADWIDPESNFKTVTLPDTPLVSFRLVDPRPLDQIVRVKTAVNPFNAAASYPLHNTIAGYLDELAPTANGDLASLLGAFQLTPASGIDAAFASFSPDSYQAMTALTITNGLDYLRSLQRRMLTLRAPMMNAGFAGLGSTPYLLAFSGNDTSTVGMLNTPMAGPTPGRHLSVDGFLVSGDRDASRGYTGFDYTSWNFSLSPQLVQDNFVAGASVGYSHTDIDFSDGRGDGDIRAWYAALFGSYYTENAYFEAGLAFSEQDYNNKRNVRVGGFSATAESDHDGDVFLAFAGTGYTFENDAWALQPFASLYYTWIDEDGFTETGAGAANLTVDEQTTESLVGEAGLRASKRFDAYGGDLDLDLSIGVNHDFDIDNRKVTAGLPSAPGTSFTIDDRDIEKTSAVFGAGVTFGRRKTTASLQYRGQFNGDQDSHAVMAAVRIQF